MSKLVDSIETLIEKDINSLGYELEYVENVKEGENKIVRVVIDKKDESLTTEDCELVSRKIEDKVDSITSDESYVLEVSSPGLERALKNTKLFNKYIGFKVRISLFKKIEGMKDKEIVGTLLKADEDTVEILVDSKTIKIDRKNIAVANTVYDFEF